MKRSAKHVSLCIVGAQALFISHISSPMLLTLEYYLAALLDGVKVTLLLLLLLNCLRKHT